MRLELSPPDATHPIAGVEITPEIARQIVALAGVPALEGERINSMEARLAALESSHWLSRYADASTSPSVENAKPAAQVAELTRDRDEARQTQKVCCNIMQADRDRALADRAAATCKAQAMREMADEADGQLRECRDLASNNHDISAVDAVKAMKVDLASMTERAEKAEDAIVAALGRETALRMDHDYFKSEVARLKEYAGSLEASFTPNGDFVRVEKYHAARAEADALRASRDKLAGLLRAARCDMVNHEDQDIGLINNIDHALETEK